jgi:hypothetical protein
MLVAVEDQHSIAMRPGTSCLITDEMVVSGGPPLDVSYMTAHFIHGRKEEAWRVLGALGRLKPWVNQLAGGPFGSSWERLAAWNEILACLQLPGEKYANTITRDCCSAEPCYFRPGNKAARGGGVKHNVKVKRLHHHNIPPPNHNHINSRSRTSQMLN